MHTIFISAERKFKVQGKNLDSTCLQTRVEVISCNNLITQIK